MLTDVFLEDTIESNKFMEVTIVSKNFTWWWQNKSNFTQLNKPLSRSGFDQ